MSEMDDNEALSLAAQGNHEAFGVLYERYVSRIYSYIYYRTGNSGDAEDLTARVFQRAMDHIGRYRNMGVPFSAWLYRIAHNLVANWHRDNSRRKEVPLENNPELYYRGDVPEVALVKQQEVEVLLSHLHKMPAERQQLLILKFVEGLSNAEIGVIMNRSEGAVKSLYHRTLTTLRDYLEKSR